MTEYGKTLKFNLLFQICHAFLSPSNYYIINNDNNEHNNDDNHNKDYDCKCSIYAYCAYDGILSQSDVLIELLILGTLVSPAHL